MAEDIPEKEVKQPDKELPQPRFHLVSKIFDDIDTILAKYDETEHLSIFEFEILVLMVRKKIEHLGIMTALEHGDHEEPKGNPQVYS